MATSLRKADDVTMMQGEMSRMIYFHVEDCTSGSNGPNPSMPSASSENNAPSEAMIQLMAPDGYYKYLGVDKSVATASADEAPQIDLDKVKKSYRKLSLKHHPDKPSGDVDTFRLLNRAHRVLTDPKLRQQYDVLGLDLADEQVDEQHQEDDEKPQEATTAQTIITEIAGYVLTFVVQLLVRTGAHNRSASKNPCPRTSHAFIRQLSWLFCLSYWFGIVGFFIQPLSDSRTSFSKTINPRAPCRTLLRR